MHEIINCSCGKMISQCRCPAKDKTVRVIQNGCADCKMTTPQPQQNKNKVTRFEVIDETGRIYVNNSCKIELSYQDDDRTLKVFVEDKKSATPTVDEKFQEIFGKYEPVKTPELTEEPIWRKQFVAKFVHAERDEYNGEDDAWLEAGIEEVMDFIGELLYHKDQELELQRRELDKEIIICAAIKTAGNVIVRGHRHNQCINTAHGMSLGTQGRTEGFITSKNRFVDRAEAYMIHFGEQGTLYSEDLY